MCEELSYQIIRYFSSQSSCLLLLLEVCKDHYKQEKIAADGNEQLRDALF